MATTIGALGLFAVLLVEARHTASRPDLGSVLMLAAFLIWATNFSQWLPGAVGVTPDLMVVMLAVGAFWRHGGVLAAALVGLSGGLIWRILSNPTRTLWRNLLLTSFNCTQLLLAAAAAASVYGLIADGTPGRGLVAAAGAAMVYALVNVSLILAEFGTAGDPVGPAWAEMRPVLPNFFAFGIIGALAGQLYSQLGVLSLVLLVVPSLIARRTYQSTLELREAQAQTIAVFLGALRAKDLYTALHTERVARYATYIGEQLGWRGAKLIHLEQAALMHDIGKLAVSSRLLNKPGRLTPEEYNEVRRHNEVCVGILAQVEFLRSTIPVASDRHGFLDPTTTVVDPAALEGYMVSVADAFDAMTSTRAYRKALAMDVAFAELRKGKGTQFHSGCVEALVSAIESRGEHYGAGYEADVVEFDVEPPAAGVGSAGLGDLDRPPLPSRRPSNVSGAGRIAPFGMT